MSPHAPPHLDLVVGAQESTHRGSTATAEQRRRMGELADGLAASRPASTRDMLTGTWDLAYTTEKEVLSLIGDPGASLERPSSKAVDGRLQRLSARGRGQRHIGQQRLAVDSIGFPWR